MSEVDRLMGRYCPDEDDGEQEERSICAECQEEMKASLASAFRVIEKHGHTAHCARRLVWGDGECECKRGAEPKRVPVTSSNIASIGYDAVLQTLTVEFKGGRLYRYHDVPKETHEALMRADSVGGYFARHVKGVHHFEQIGVDDGI